MAWQEAAPFQARGGPTRLNLSGGGGYDPGFNLTGAPRRINEEANVSASLEHIKTRLNAAADAVDTERSMANDDHRAAEIRAQRNLQHPDRTRREQLNRIDKIFKMLLRHIMGRGCASSAVFILTLWTKRPCTVTAP